MNDVHSELANYERKLHDISEDQKDKECQCLKEWAAITHASLIKIWYNTHNKIYNKQH